MLNKTVDLNRKAPRPQFLKELHQLPVAVVAEVELVAAVAAVHRVLRLKVEQQQLYKDEPLVTVVELEHSR